MKRSPIGVAAAIVLGLVLTTVPTASPSSAGVVRGDPRKVDADSWVLQGEAAVRALGDELPSVAGRIGMRATDLRRVLLTDSTASIDSGGNLLFTDPAHRGSGTLDRRDASFPLDQTFALHSRPSSAHTIFLDFDGRTVSGTLWNFPVGGVTNGFHQGYTLDDDFASFSDLELEQIQSIWQRVAEDFAPFDVNVTTQDPGTAAIDRSGASDDAYGTVVFVSSDPDSSWELCKNTCGGKASVSSFDRFPGHSYRQPAWVFPPLLGSNTKVIAEEISHEAGHTLGLSHDGGPGAGDKYYTGHDVWGPIMGNGHGRPLVQWSRGEYVGATNGEDDLAVMASHGAPAVGDEAPDDFVGAPTLSPGTGYITSSSDRDTYSLGVCAGPVTLAATGAELSPDLDIRLELLRGNTVVQSADPAAEFVDYDLADGLSASLSVPDLPATTYYARVDGVGHGTEATGYSDYGSIGAYTVAATGCGIDAPSVPRDLDVVAAPDGRSATLTWREPAGDGGSSITGYLLRRSDPATTVPAANLGDVRTYTWTGLTPGLPYTFTVRAKNGVYISQPATRTVTMPVPPAPPAPGPLAIALGPDGTSATVTWSAPPDNQGSPIGSYLLTHTGQSAPADPVVVGQSVFTYTWSGLTPGETYTFSVRAQNVAGVVGPPATDSLSVPATVPGVPSSVQVAPGSGGSGVEVSWSPPSSNGGSEVIGYRLTRTDLAHPAATLKQFVASPSVAWTDVRPGATYALTIRAENGAGLGQGLSTSFDVPATMPGAPADLVVDPAADGRSVELSWSPPAFDGGSDIVGYTVTRTDPDDPATPLRAPVSVRTYTWTGLTPGEEYTFTVRARSAAGAGTSAAQTVRTPTPVPTPVVTTVTMSASSSAARVLQVGARVVAGSGGLAPTGVVRLADATSGKVLGSAVLVGGVASGRLAGLTPGARRITASYVPAPGSPFASSTATASVRVKAASVLRESFPAKVRKGVAGVRGVVRVRYAGLAAKPTGRVLIKEGAHVVGRGHLVKGRVAFRLQRAKVGAGRSTLTLVFTGDRNGFGAQKTFRIVFRGAPLHRRSGVQPSMGVNRTTASWRDTFLW